MTGADDAAEVAVAGLGRNEDCVHDPRHQEAPRSGERPVQPPVEDPSTALGNWCATAVFWKPQVALLVNERTLLPVFMPLAPVATLGDRFSEQLGMVLEGFGVPTDFVLQEVTAMVACSYAKTTNRSVVGSMNDFAFMADAHRAHGDASDLVALSVKLAGTTCGPLRKGHELPDREVEALAEEWYRH